MTTPDRIDARRPEVDVDLGPWEAETWRDDGSDPWMLGPLLNPHGVPQWVRELVLTAGEQRSPIYLHPADHLDLLRSEWLSTSAAFATFVSGRPLPVLGVEVVVDPTVPRGTARLRPAPVIGRWQP